MTVRQRHEWFSDRSTKPLIHGLVMQRRPVLVTEAAPTCRQRTQRALVRHEGYATREAAELLAGRRLAVDSVPSAPAYSQAGGCLR